MSQYRDVKNQFPFNLEMLNKNNIIAVATQKTRIPPGLLCLFFTVMLLSRIMI